MLLITQDKRVIFFPTITDFNCLAHADVRDKRQGSEIVLQVSYMRVYEISAGGVRSIYPTLGIRLLFGDVTMNQWRHNQPT